MQDGGIGKVYMARGLCFKPRPSIGKYPDGPMAPGEKFALTVGSTDYLPPYDAQYLSKVDYDLWLGPASKRPFNRNRFHYNWHWQWEYGNGDTGNQGPHQFDIARWGLGKQEHPVKVSSMGGYFGGESQQETPDMQTALYEYADGTILEFGTRGEHTNDEGGQRIGNLFYGTKGWLWIDETGRRWQSYMGPLGAKNEKGPGADTPPDAGAEPVGLTTTEFPHYQNFIDAIRANDPKKLTCDIMEGHLSSTLPHLANISYRVGHGLVFDGKSERFVDDKKADTLLTREYRKGFEIPKSLS
jgi:Oxidoreductase family, C-terminal alpha/beta domain